MTDGQSISRRRAITIIAGCVALPATGLSMETPAAEWRGTALGADARIIFRSDHTGKAEETLSAVREEIERLENIFSLYRPNSCLSALNRDGSLMYAPLEMMALTRRALWYTDITGGAFDITVQPLWELYAGHFASYDKSRHGPSPAKVAAARARIGPHRIELTATSIRLEPGTKLTFNGIAQGFITDRVADLLRQSGWRNVLIQLGETRALGLHPDGRAWRIGLPDGKTTTLKAGALATSSAAGTRFGSDIRHHHLFDPSSGRSAASHAAVTVAAPRATDADALSTAIFVLPAKAHAGVLAMVPGTSIVTGKQGS